MTWQTGTATDHINLLRQIRSLATGRHVATAAINAGGTGYAVDDILTVAGGTSDHSATLRVTTVSAGVITGVAIETGGAFTVDPTTTANAVTGGTGSGATMNLTLADTGWSVLREGRRAVSATIGAGGSGYAVNDKLTVNGLGTTSPSLATTAAVFNVDSVSAGAVTAVSLDSAGFYEEVPTNAAATVTDNSGTGCTLNVTYEVVDDAETILVMSGAAAGGGETVKVAVKTYNQANGADTARNWAVFGMADFNAGLLLHQQDSLSPGLELVSDVLQVDNQAGAFVPLKQDTPSPTFPIVWFASVTDRRIVIAARVETAVVRHYATTYMGLVNQFGGAVEFPYPIYVAGSCAESEIVFDRTSAASTFTGLTVAAGVNVHTGPGFFRDGTGLWRDVKNSSSTSRSEDAVVYPFGVPDTPPTPVVSAGGGLDFRDLTDHIAGQAPDWELWPTPGASDDQRVLIPAIVMSSEAGVGYYPLGELEGVFWFSYADGGVAAASEDRFEINGVRYRIVQNGNRTQLTHDFMAIRED